jgi:hypothetical protein
MAKLVDKPLVIHDRDAHDDVLRLVDEEGAPRVVVMHCFSGDAAFAQACVDRGFMLSFAGTVTFKNAQSLRDALAALGYGWAGISRRPAGLRHGRREREQWVLRLSGPGVDKLSEELGWKMAPRQRRGEHRGGRQEVARWPAGQAAALLQHLPQ